MKTQLKLGIKTNYNATQSISNEKSVLIPSHPHPNNQVSQILAAPPCKFCVIQVQVGIYFSLAKRRSIFASFTGIIGVVPILQDNSYPL